MKCIVLLTFVALCSGYRTGFTDYGNNVNTGRNFNINPDGSVTLTTSTGKRITITKGTGENNVNTVTDPTVFGYQSWYQWPRQNDVSAQIFNQYHGDVDQDTYQQQMVQNQIMKQQFPQQHNQYPFWQTNDEVVVPVGVNQQGRIVQRMMQVPQTMNTFHVYGNQDMMGQQRFGMYGDDTGKTSWINRMLYGNKQWQTVPNVMFNRFGQQITTMEQPITAKLSQLIEAEREILNQQDRIQGEQMVQHQQQQVLTQQQWQQQQQQQYMQHMQEQMQKEQEQVMGQQQQIQNEQQYKFMTPYTRMFQRTGFKQQQPTVYTQRVFGGYGQDVPVVM